MGLKDLLEKMKLVEFEEAETTAAASVATAAAQAAGISPPPPPRRGAGPSAPPPSLRAVVDDADAKPKIDEAALARATGGSQGDAAAEVPDFPAIYSASGVGDPPHGFSAYKVLEMLSSSDFAALEPRAKAAALAGFLKMVPGGPVPITDVIQDALQRDRALDSFEEFLRKKLDARRTELEKDNERLQAEIDELTRRNREAMEANRGALEAEKQRFATWQARKRIEERRLFDAVAPFVEENPVTLGSRDAAGATTDPGAGAGRPGAGTTKPSGS